MKPRILILFTFLGLGCSRDRLRTSLPPLPPSDPRCAIDKISKIDVNRFHAPLAAIGPSYAKSEYYYQGYRGDGGYAVADGRFPWVSPDSAVCLRLTVARSPHCPTPEGSLDCRNDWYWWQEHGPVLDTALRRIQVDQKSCRLAGVYEEFLTYPHTDEEKAAVCLGMLQLDPELHPCLEQNITALQKLVKTKQRSDRQTYATILFNSAFTDSGIPLWDHDYDAAFAWIQKNLFLLMNPRQDGYASQRYYRIAAVIAYRNRDREALMQAIAQASQGKFSVLSEMYLLARLEIHGDEGERLLSFGAKAGTEGVWSSVLQVTDKLKKEGRPGYDPIRTQKCSY